MADGRDPVKSPVTQWLSHVEFAAYAEGIDPGTAERICNRLMFGHPAGSAAYEEGGPRRYELTAAGEMDDVLRHLATRPGLNALDLTAIRRVRHLLYGGDPDRPGPEGGYPVTYSGAI